MKKIVRIFFLLIVLISAVSACKKDSSQNDVPNVQVDFNIYLSEPSNVNLNSLNQSVYFSYGVKGIVVSRTGPESFVALERNCTYQPNNSSAVVSIDTSATSFLKDSSCGSRFYLSDGSVANGPSTVPLKQYHTFYNASNLTVHVYN